MFAIEGGRGKCKNCVIILFPVETFDKLFLQML